MAEKYTLPELPYDYAALEPHISARLWSCTTTSTTQHTLQALTQLSSSLKRHARTVHTATYPSSPGPGVQPGRPHQPLHLLEQPVPEGGDKPTGELAAAIDEFFGSFDKFREHFTNVALTIQGSGWAILAWDTVGKRLIIEQLYDQQGNISVALIPVLQLDMWEHAFYLDYQNVKGEYVKAFWNIVNWADVQARFERAVSQTKGLVL